jgi:hypothetical protein
MALGVVAALVAALTLLATAGHAAQRWLRI